MGRGVCGGGGGGVASQNLAEWGTCLSKPHAPRAPRCHQGPLIRNQSLSRALPALHDLCQPLFQPHLSFHLHHQVSYPAATLPRSGLPSPAPGNGCRELQPVHGQKMEASRFGCNAHAYTDASLSDLPPFFEPSDCEFIRHAYGWDLIHLGNPRTQH